MADAPRDGNHVPATLLESSTVSGEVLTAKGLQATGALLVSITGSVPGSVNFEIPTGTVNGVNTTFTVTNTPRYLVVDGSQKFNATYNPSNPSWSYSAPTITILDGSPPVLSIVSAY